MWPKQAGFHGHMAELADALDLGSSEATRGGSSPSMPTWVLNYGFRHRGRPPFPVGHCSDALAFTAQEQETTDRKGCPGSFSCLAYIRA